MSGIEIALAVTAVAATAASTTVAVNSANKQAKAARDATQLELNQYAEEKKAAADQALQAANEVRRNQQAARSAMTARISAAGLDPFGPTGRVLLDQTDDNADADVESIWANVSRTTAKLDYGAQASTLRGRSAIDTAGAQSTGALISGAGSIASTGYRYLSAAEDRAALAAAARRNQQ